MEGPFQSSGFNHSKFACSVCCRNRQPLDRLSRVVRRKVSIALDHLKCLPPAELFYKLKDDFPLVIREIPVEERDPSCPIRLRVSLASQEPTA